jgi:hypothetical protein
MPRNYSEKFLIAVNKLDQESYGVKLAKGCVKANIPAQYIADALGVSRMTIHSWFRGKPIRHKNTQSIKAVLAIIDLGLLEGSLPSTTMQGAKDFAHKVKVELNTVEQ